MRIVYLEKNFITDEFITSCIYTAWEGFKNLGYNVQPFYFNEMDSLDISKGTIVSGYIRSAHKAFQIIGCPIPDEISIPDELLEFAGRKIWHSTLGQIRQDEPYCFIKPLKGQKLFTGHVRDGNMGYLVQTAGLSDETELLCSEVVRFATEWRGFVLDRKLIGLKNYKGDFTLIPNADLIHQAIEQYTSSPIAYSIDVGVTDEGKTVLVEINDAFALGSYGLEPDRYVAMIEARWDEIVNVQFN